MKDLGKPGAREPHARFDEGRLETGSGLGTAEPTMQCVDSAGPPRLPRQPPTLLLDPRWVLPDHATVGLRLLVLLFW
jgi:hypothetical protein